MTCSSCSVKDLTLSMRTFRLCVVLGSIFITYFTMVSSHPAHKYRAPGQNIRRFTCSVKTSALKGVCMFALDCRRANGTNLGTCVDHFFFGSCCRLPQGTKDGTTDRSTATPLTTVVRTGILLSNEIIPSTPSISSSKWPQMHSAATTIETTTSTPQTDDIQSLFTTLSSEWKMSSSTMSELDNETVVGHIDSNAIITDSKTWSVPTTTVTTVKPLVTSQQSYHSIVTSEPTSTLDNYVTETLPSSERITTTSSGSIDDADTSLPWTSSETEQVSVTLSEYWPTATTTMILTTSTDIVSATSNPTTTTTTTTTTEQEVTTKSSTLPLTIPSSTTIVNTVTTTTENVTETPSSTAPPTTPEEPFDFDTLSETDYTTACGRQVTASRPTGRIVNGHVAEFGEWPWQISLRQWKRTTFMHKCGAALLNENWAITAAHCVDGVPPEDLLLRIGEYDLSSDRETRRHVERRVHITTTHPDFNSRTFDNDLALLRFRDPVTFQENIIPICLPTDDDRFVNRTGYVTGWGRLYVDGPLPTTLQEVQVPIITNSQCEQEYRLAGFLESIPDIFLCAGYPEGERDSCEGDSGGPLVIKQPNNRWVLAGVISWGIGCAEPHQPGVYTRISRFREWINQILVF